MGDSVFVITKQGVYRHAIYGVYTLRGVAHRAAKAAIRAEFDDYHDFHMLEFELDVPAKVDEENSAMTSDDAHLVRIYKKEAGEISWEKVQ